MAVLILIFRWKILNFHSINYLHYVALKVDYFFAVM